ncbi:hypothetical protein ES707_07403 [subsurface metagenome]
MDFKRGLGEGMTYCIARCEKNRKCDLVLVLFGVFSGFYRGSQKWNRGQ